MSKPNLTPSEPPRRSDEPRLLPHNYDGIQEYDQRLPNWWLFTFYITIVFAFFYWVSSFQLGAQEDDGLAVDAELLSLKLFNPSRMMAAPSNLDAQLWKWSRDPNYVQAGKETFDLICAACHGKDLSATINGVPLPGLPLNDSEWKYGSKPTDILKIVAKGSPDVSKGMVAWEPQLGEKKCLEVVAYILSHHEKPDPAAEATSPTEGEAETQNTPPQSTE